MRFLWAVIFFSLGYQMSSGTTAIFCGLLMAISGYLLGSMME